MKGRQNNEQDVNNRKQRQHALQSSLENNTKITSDKVKGLRASVVFVLILNLINACIEMCCFSEFSHVV